MIIILQVFLDTSDYFFTDYHWNYDMLKTSVTNAANNISLLFHGIDIWGRGSYAGGQFNTWEGCKVI